MTRSGSKAFWNRAAASQPAWHIATKFRDLDAAFYESGRREVAEFLATADLNLTGNERLLEIGCGAGRMTGALANRVKTLIAADVSSQMLSLAKDHLAETHNIEYLELSGDGDLPIETETIDVVFSYITMQHVPTAEAQERYISESIRVLKPGGRGLIQFRRPGIRARVLDWVGHLTHAVSGHRTLSSAWRGVRLSRKRLIELTGECVSVALIPSSSRHIWLSFQK